MALRVAIVGATGNVGRAVAQTLFERDFPVARLTPLASSRSAGAEVSFGDSVIKVQDAATFDFSQEDLVFFCADTRQAERLIPRILSTSKAYVIDKSSAYRMDPHVPLIVPEVNARDLAIAQKKRVIASPNCVVIPLALTLSPLRALGDIQKVIVSTYQSVSGAGKEAMDELYLQTKATYVAEHIPPQAFTKPIAFNVIPQIEGFEQDGFTGEETKIILELKKILSPSVQITPTCVRVPVFVGHCAAVTVTFDKKVAKETAREIFKSAASVTLFDNPQEELFATPLDVAGEDTAFVSRLRQNPRTPQDLTFWVACDNLRKGAALNAVQIAQELLAQEMMRS